MFENIYKNEIVNLTSDNTPKKSKPFNDLVSDIMIKQ